jgi:hypothetical protein
VADNKNKGRGEGDNKAAEKFEQTKPQPSPVDWFKDGKTTPAGK